MPPATSHFVRLVELPPGVAARTLEPPPGLRWHSAAEGDAERFVGWARGAVAALLPPDVREALAAWAEGGDEAPPALLLRGLGVDVDLEGTEAVREAGFQKRGQRSEAWILGIAALFGDVLATDEKALGQAAAERVGASLSPEPEPDKWSAERGALGGPAISIGNLVARQGRSRTRVAHDGTPLSGLADLNIHRDGMFDEFGTYNYTDGGDELFMPDKLFLFCNRGDPGGEALTWLTDMRTLYDLLSPEDRQILATTPLRFFDGADTAGGRDYQESYRAAVAPNREGHDNPNTVSGSAACPKISLQESRPVDRENSDAAACDAYDRLFKLGQEVREGVALQAGDLLLVKNNRALHGRSPYHPRYDDSDRWVQRFTSYRPAQIEAARNWLDRQHQPARL